MKTKISCRHRFRFSALKPAFLGLIAFALAACGGGGEGGGSAQPPSFHVAGAKVLLANQDTVQAVASPGAALAGSSRLTYRVVNQGLPAPAAGEAARGVYRAAAGESGTNLMAVDELGNTWLAIQASNPVQVMYSAVDPAGAYVYLALNPGWYGAWDGNDYGRFVAEQNCAFYKVSLADDSYACVQPGMAVEEIDDFFRQMISDDRKPIQFDVAGNLVFAGTEFVREGTPGAFSIRRTSWNPRLYRLDAATGGIAPFTQDIQAVNAFLTLSSGEVVYHGFEQIPGTSSYKDELWVWQNEATIDLDNTAEQISFFASDSANAILWGDWFAESPPGILFSRPAAAGGMEKAILDTSLFGTGIEGNPRRVLQADDGRLYGIFVQAGATADTLSLFQILPYDGTPKLQISIAKGSWWDWMRLTPFQVSNGSLFYVETVDPADGYGPREVINLVDMGDLSADQILSQGRYDIYNWKLSGDVLYFAALDKSNTTVVLGEIDTRLVRDGATVEEFLTMSVTASALGAISEVQDIEIVAAAASATDSGVAPSGQIHTAPDNVYSVSLDFTKPMNQASVEAGLTFADEFGNPVPNMKVWVRNSLHLIPDLGGLLDSAGTTPLADGAGYSVSLDTASEDIFGSTLESDLSTSWTTGVP